MLGERCSRIGLATTSPWIFQATVVPALVMPFCESGATSLSSEIACKTEKEQTVFFTAVNPMFAHPHKQQDYDVTKPRIAVYKQNEKNISEYCVLGQFESCSEEGVDVLSNKIQRNHPSQHSPSSVY